MPAIKQTEFIRATGSIPFVAKELAIQENVKFQARVNEEVLKENLPRTRRIVILSQHPRPGDDVPLGTVVNVTLALKDDLLMSSLGAIEAVSSKWANAALVEAAVVNAGPTAPALQNILTAKAQYSELTDSDRTVFDAFVSQQGLASVDKAKVYNDVQFAFTL